APHRYEGSFPTRLLTEKVNAKDAKNRRLALKWKRRAKEKPCRFRQGDGRMIVLLQTRIPEGGHSRRLLILLIKWTLPILQHTRTNNNRTLCLILSQPKDGGTQQRRCRGQQRLAGSLPPSQEGDFLP